MHRFDTVHADLDGGGEELADGRLEFVGQRQLVNQRVFAKSLLDTSSTQQL